jgi:WD40 repeat protein
MLHFLAITLPLLGSGPVRQEPSPSYAETFAAAWSALDAKDWDRARASYSAALELDAENPTCAYHLACVEARAGNVPLALDWLERAAARGWLDADVARWDEDLSALRENSRFLECVERMRSARAAQPQGDSGVEIVWNWLNDPSYLQQDATPDLQHVLTLHENEAFVWSVSSERVRCVLHGHTGRVHWASLTDDGTRAITSSEDGSVRLWDAESGSQLAELDGLGRLAIVTFDRRGRRVMAWDAFGDRAVAVLDVESREPLLELEGPLHGVELSADGTRLLALRPSVEHGGEVRAVLWDVDDEAILVELDSLGMPQGHASFSPQGTRLLVQEFPKSDVDLTRSQVLTIHVLESRRGTLLFSRRLPDLQFGLLHNFFTARFVDEERILVCGTEEGVELLDAATGEVTARVPSDSLNLDELRRATSPQTMPPTIVPSPDGSWFLIERPGRGLARLDLDGRVRDLPSIPELAGTSLYPGFPSRILSADGTRMLLRRNGYAALVDTSDGSIEAELELPRLTTCATKPAQGAKHALIGCSDGSLRRVDLDSAEIVNVEQLSDAALVELMSVESLERVLVSDEHGSHYVLDGPDLQLAGRFSSTTSSSSATGSPSISVGGSRASLSPDGRWLATWAPRGRADVWDVERRVLIAGFDDMRVWSAAWTKDGARLALCGRDALGTGSVSLIDTARGTLALPPLQHPAPVSCVAFSSDGRMFATGSGDGHARVWDTSTGLLVRDIPHEDLFGPEDSVEQVAFHSKGDVLFTSSSSPVHWSAWDISSGRARWRVEGRGQWAPRFDLDEATGRLLATCWDTQVLDVRTGASEFELDDRAIAWMVPLQASQRVLARDRGTLSILDQRTLHPLVSRVEYEHGGELRISASGHVALTPGVAHWVWVRTQSGLHALDDLAPQLFDPKRVRAAAAGIEVAPARVP